ncbi:50S ribosomal protein L30 [Leptospira biflexa]|jgi:large subunit ribosomal protein L30|uniref:Large ribosomal subunit protein uL30 n=2 Tax=Leptospira biflexa serovar Patoc TaxID=145259 RepID=RL30_LEPBP|nr:50S ribosomal protein L30 [Leptospira biflexa]B0SA29.1 RecName: Full=Large ribosomal subunit protein uL30; AltName: Full=50S ribosomal protein L30 [Leptospira biflexa serovar Patoc strain 'Patoc 1 (Ames)']B0SSG0.1 RecName: Full=Large ribosomal subunit protein uL30; AltName: Full=50S ribosomal protein L30 [Leptospira biflexa serovar Patoc strain 'Patoc 1 (Paris)']ABZ94399.1 50S Ribosomal protein L30 [Leptospira biflexa serovar Patoc strain 'Patoc 1 (Ames)']ABZ98050.1 50S ribosomal protein L30
MEEVIVTQDRSSIGIIPMHKKTLIALGLKKKGQSKKHKMTPQLKGMLRQVGYLLKVEKV